MKPITMAVHIRIGDAPEREIGTITADSWHIAKSQVAEALREAADVIAAEEATDATT